MHLEFTIQEILPLRPVFLSDFANLLEIFPVFFIKGVGTSLALEIMPLVRYKAFQ